MQAKDVGFFFNRQHQNSIINKTNTKVQFAMQLLYVISLSTAQRYTAILVLFCSTWCSVTESAIITVLVLKAAAVIFPAGILFTLKLHSLFFWSWFWSVLRFLPSTFFDDFLCLVSVINTFVFDIVQTKLSFGTLNSNLLFVLLDCCLSYTWRILKS